MDFKGRAGGNEGTSPPLLPWQLMEGGGTRGHCLHEFPSGEPPLSKSPWLHLSLCPQLPVQMPTFSGGVSVFPPRCPTGTGMVPSRPSTHTPPEPRIRGPFPSLGILPTLTPLGLRAHGCLGPDPDPSPCAFQEKKQRRAENLKRRLENERKAEIVQVVSGVLLGLGVSPDASAPLPPLSC